MMMVLLTLCFSKSTKSDHDASVASAAADIVCYKGKGADHRICVVSVAKPFSCLKSVVSWIVKYDINDNLRSLLLLTTAHPCKSVA